MSRRVRTIFRIAWSAREGRWVLSRRSATASFEPQTFRFKVYAIAVAAQRCRELERGGELAQLVVHGKSGRIQFERTYGADPERSRG